MHATFPMTNTVLFITLVHLQGPFSEATAGTNRTNACLVIAKSVVQPHICIIQEARVSFQRKQAKHLLCQGSNSLHMHVLPFLVSFLPNIQVATEKLDLLKALATSAGNTSRTYTHQLHANKRSCVFFFPPILFSKLTNKSSGKDFFLLLLKRGALDLVEVEVLFPRRYLRIS